MNQKHIIITIVLVLLMCGTASAWLSGYDHRMNITVNNGGASTLNYYQFNFTNDTNTLVAAGHMLTSGADCRVTDASDNLIPFWNETAFNASGTEIYANATSLTVGDNTFCMYYGNSAVSTVADGEATFDFFDDFEDIVYSASRAAGSSIGFNAACSRVVVADDGTWLMVYRATSAGAAPSSHEGQVWLRNSTDSGETWSSGTKLSSDSYDAINAEFIKYPNGDIDVFYMRYSDSTNTRYDPNMVSRSTDNGSTWSSFSACASPLTGCAIMWQDITIGNDVYLVTYKVNTSTVLCDNKFYKTTDNGSTWTYISDITTNTTDGSYAEPGMVYLGDGDFVVVLRDLNTTTHTLQRRSTDWGVTWTTDGYIKNNGSVAASGVGTDVTLHMCRIWNKDINDSDLDYIYMQAALYPGSYPRDMYAYISTDNCMSWGTVDPIYTASDCHDSAIVFKNATSAKYYPGKISGESATTADDITISSSFAGTPSTSKWDVLITAAELSGDYAFTGARSAKFPGTGALQKTLAHSDNIAIKYWAYYPDQIGTMYSLVCGDSISRLYTIVGTPAPGDISYHDGAWQDTGVNSITGAWAAFEAKDFNWSAHTQDILYNDVVIANDVGQRPAGTHNNIAQVSASGATYYIDCYLVRKYSSPEPTASLGAEENAHLAKNDIILGTNQHGLLRKNVAAAETFSTIAAGIDHDRCYTWWDSTNDRWESYRVGRAYNAAKSVPQNDSYFVLMDGTGTMVSCSIAVAGTIAIPAGYYATYLRESTNKTLSAIKTDMGGNANDLWAFDPTTGAWTDTGTHTVLPNQGLMVYATAAFDWDGTVP